MVNEKHPSSEVTSHPFTEVTSGGSLASCMAIMARSLFSRLGTACLFVFVRYQYNIFSS